jgi:hypothetical protein
MGRPDVTQLPEALIEKILFAVLKGYYRQPSRTDFRAIIAKMVMNRRASFQANPAYVGRAAKRFYFSYC